MGCDIHPYIEYTYDGDSDDPHWQCFAAGFGGRDYWLFGLLAGVRDDTYGPVVEPRGAPDKLSYTVDDAYYLRISDAHADEEGFCSLANAERWGRNIILHPSLGTPWKTVGPDWHTAGWLTSDELERALAIYMTHYQQLYGAEWDAALASMRALEQRGATTRLTFWFDN